MSPERLPTGVGTWSCGSDSNDHLDLKEREIRMECYYNIYFYCLICIGLGNGMIFV